MTVSILALICAPTFMTLMFTGQAGLVAALTLFAWPLLFRERGVAGGSMLAVAGALKIFPLILLVPLLLRRRYFAVGVTLAAVVALNIGGAGIAGRVADGCRRWPERRLDDLGRHGTQWFVGHDPVPNRRGRLASQAIAIAVLGFFLTAAVMTRKEKGHQCPLPWIISGLLLVPLSWLSYDVILMPALACLLLAKDLRPRLLGMTGWSLWVTPTLLYAFVFVDLGTLSVVVRVLLLVVWWLGWLTWTDKGLGSTWVVAPIRPRARAEVSS